MSKKSNKESNVIKRIVYKVLEIERTDGKKNNIKKTEIVEKIKKVIEEEIC